MDVLREHLGKRALLHAYGVAGPDTLEDVTSFIEEELQVPLTGNADAFYIEADSFGIEESRALGAFALTEGLGPRRVALIAVRTLTHEAQNALLKLLEDTPEGLHVFLLVSSFPVLLPTLRSRLFLCEGSVRTEFDLGSAEEFLAATPAKRLLILAPLIEERERGKLDVLIDGLEVLLARAGGSRNALLSLTRARRYLLDRSVSLKLLFESLALSL
jgi:hypothetical protein